MRLFHIGVCAFLFLLTGCERQEIKDAKLNGEIVTDTKGRKWLLKHHMGNTYILNPVNEDGTINFPE